MDIYEALVYLNLLGKLRRAEPNAGDLSITFFEHIGGEVFSDGYFGRDLVFEFSDPEDLVARLKAEVRKERDDQDR